VYVIEAQLALLLRLAGAGGPGGRMGSAKALQDATAIPYLCRQVGGAYFMWLRRLLS
jgi:hypothetical protein